MGKSGKRRHRLGAGAIVLALALTLGQAGAPGAARASEDPLFVFSPSSNGPAGPCGSAVVSSGCLYVSDYYDGVVDVYTSGFGFVKALAADNPCGIAVDSAKHLYVASYHGGVAKSGSTIDAGPATGVAVDAAT